MGSPSEVQPNIARLAQPDYPASYPPEWLVIQPNHDVDVSYPPHVSGFVWRAVYEVDQALQDAASHTQEDQLVVWKNPLNETQPSQNAVLSVIHEQLVSRDDIRVLGLFHGATPGFMSLWNAQDHDRYRANMESVRINGYLGKEAVDARLWEDLSPLNIDAHLIYVLDDVWETGHELAAVLMAIEALRGVESDTSIVSRLKDTRNQPFENYIQLYDEIIARFHKQGVVIAELFYKNETFRQRLWEYAHAYKDTDDWGSAQWDILQPTLLYAKKDWLMGEGLDTDIDGAVLVGVLQGLLSPELLESVQLQELFDYLSVSKLRIGSFVEGLIALQRDSKTDLVAFVADQWIAILEEWKNAGFRWEYMYPPPIDSQAALTLA